MNDSIRLMTAAIAEILRDNHPSVYLYGSAVLEDFRPGWSDIDLLVLTDAPISIPQSEQLLTLRQSLPIAYPDANMPGPSRAGCLRWTH